MRQVLIKRTQGVRVNPADPSELQVLAAELVQLRYGVVNPVHLYGGLLEAVSGKPKFKFSVPKELARQGITLIGAYLESGAITAYFSIIEGSDIYVEQGQPILTVESANFDALTLVDGDARFQGGVLVLNPEEAPTKKKGRGRKKAAGLSAKPSR